MFSLVVPAFEIDLIKLIVALMLASTPLVLAALGELIVEKAGVLNLGVEGMMIMGAVGGFAIAVETGNPFLGMLFGGISGMFLSVIFSILTQRLHTNQVATGLALTMFGLGVAALIGQNYEGVKPPVTSKLTFIEPLKDVTILGAAFVLISFFTVFLMWKFLKHSRKGLVLRAVGENHYAAHSIGYNVIRIRIMAISFGGFMAGLGGAFISLVRVPQWTEGMTAGIGWIALALVVFGSWKPLRVLIGAYLFGIFISAEINLQIIGVQIQAEYLAMMPYVMTIIVLVLISLRDTQSEAPGTLGQIFQPKS